MTCFGDEQILNPVEWSCEAGRMRGLHLLHQWPYSSQHIVGFEAAFRHAGFEEFEKWNVGGRTHEAMPAPEGR